MSVIRRQVKAIGIALLALAISASAQPASSSLSALELEGLPPAQLLERLIAARPDYRGDQADELLQLLDMLKERPVAPERPAIREAILDLLLEWPSSLPETALPPAVQRALQPPNDRLDMETRATACIGPDLLRDYPGISQVAPTEARVLFARPPLDDEALAAMTGVIERGGVLVLHTPDAPAWPVALQAWANARQVRLPTGRQPLLGPGGVSTQDYLTLADLPWSPVEQSGTPAAAAWESWPGVAPVRTSDGKGALVVVDRIGEATVVFTCVDLVSRPLYRDNLLYWLFGPALTEAQQAFPGETELAVTGQTPHRPWFRPPPEEPPLKVLYLTDNLFKRGMLELHQRLPVAYRYVPYQASLATLPAQPPQPAARVSLHSWLTLRDALPWADVLYCETGRVNLLRSLTQETMGTVTPELLPRRLRRQIHAAVHEQGLGLLVVGEEKALTAMPDIAARLETATAWDTTMAFIPPATCRSTDRGRGRMVWFGRRLEHLDFDFLRLPEEELAEPWLVPGLEAPRQPLRVSEYAYAALARTLRHAAGREPLIAGATVTEVALRLQLTRAIDATLEVHLRDRWGQATEVAKLPISGTNAEVPLRLSGPTVVECRLVNGSGHILDIASVAGEGRAPLIASIETDKRWYAPGETIHAHALLAEGAAGSLRLEVRDTWGRLLHASEGAEAAIQVREPRSRLWDIHATLLAPDGTELAWHRQPVGILLPRRERDYRITGVLLKPHSLVGALRDQLGIDVTFGDAETAFRAHLELSAGLWSDPVGVATTPAARVVPTERQPCLSSPAFRLRALRDMAAVAPRWARLGITDYMIDDESPLGNRCLCEHSLRRFRAWLRQEYSDLSELNAEWGTAHEAWDAVVPITGATAARPGALVDADRFYRWEFAEYVSYLQLLADDALPGFLAGQSGGLRDSQIMQLSGALWYYGVDEAAVAGKRPEALIGAWFEPGYRFREDHEVQARRWPWWHLLRGTTRQQLWYPKSLVPAMHADLSRPFAAYTWLRQEMADLDRGMGKLLLHAKRDEGRVAIYVSLRDRLIELALAELSGDRPPPLRHGAAIQQAVLAAQVECRMINEFQVAAGALAQRGTRLLIMPGTSALSAAECQAIEDFVSRGGRIVAAEPPGTRNAHGTYVGDAWANQLQDAGHLILAEPDAQPAQVRGWLQQAEIVPRVEVRTPSGAPVPVDRGLFQDGDALYVGFVENGTGMLDPAQRRDVEARFPGTRHLYDCRAGTYLGETDQHQTQLQPGVAHLYAALPWRLDRIDIERQTIQPGETTELQVTCHGEGAIGRQLLRVRVSDARGNDVPAHERRLLIDGGTASVRLPIARDAAPGTWTVTIRDAATGVIGTGTLDVEPRP